MSKLDQLVKGAPPPENRYDISSTTPIISTESQTSPSVPDPLASLPSSPPQIYLNLLILEASLRVQWLQLRTRRRQHTFFLMLLGLWNIYFGYALFLKPREDGSGVGGSVYWVVEVVEKVCFMGGIFTGILIWVTGQWERGIRYPRRWVFTTNRGLRGFNCKLVVIKQHWWSDIISTLGFLFSYGLFSGNNGTSYRFVDHTLLKDSEKGQRNGGNNVLPNINEHDDLGHEEDLADGGDYVQLLLLPKPFSATFRENWDIFRSEYWEKENERRAGLRKIFKARDRKVAKEEGGWLWWTGYRGFKRGKTPDIEKIHHSVHRHGTVEKRPRSGSIRSGSHSRNSSRSTTPSAEPEESTGGHSRAGSTASDRRRKKSTAAIGTRVQKLSPSGSRSVTPDVHSPLARENSYTSVSSLDSERYGVSGGDGDSTRSLKPKPAPSRKPGSSKGAK
ncbi:Sporulation-specific protein spo7 [Lachnellula hyalina]|uniref:Sporulation-specific protein spo7 n=1 Tax=Lachnellula hyalina TaxID=1316788 RepID=A0A8H8TYI9_9HELO|nr:Sporulation-specific protein spo7 [Lachnellula hyalina]TVY23966.1 Sporulation-specific protein spo7 [Lachnellula hyalina]